VTERTLHAGGTVAFVTLGCKVNQAESDAFAAAAPAARVVRDPAEADVIVVNTCTVTGEADHKTRKAVRHALAHPRRPTVVVTGCLAALDPAGLEALGERVIAEPDKTRVSDRVAALVGAQPAPGNAVPTPRRTRVQLKVEDGCDAFCTYCIVPYARGVPRAVPLGTVVAEAERLAAAGVAEVVLTGINIGRYDDNGMRLADVLTAVAATGIPRVRLSSIEPRDVDERLLETAAGTAAFCRHLHIPLQSGSDGVLLRMERPYTTAEYLRVLERVREALPDVAISTDVIAGFPGEDERQHAETLDTVARAGFSRLHVFRYSARSGTPAAGMPGQVAPAERARRAAELRETGARLMHETALAWAGREAEMLVERVRGEGEAGPRVVEGTTREYLRVQAAHPAASAGDLVTVRLQAPSGPGAVPGMIESRW
jgi:threonylcarbamoyladenosine tRNA methylthiotransferase MtaB